MQAWLLILLTGSFLITGSSFLVDLLAHLPIPPQWHLSRHGAIAILLASLGLLAVMTHRPRGRYLAGVLLAALGAYSLGHYFLTPETESGLSWLTGHSRLSPLPATLAFVMGACCLIPPDSAAARRAYQAICWMAAGIGGATLLYPLAADTPPSSVAGLTMMESSHSPLLSEAFKIEVIQKAVKYITDGVSIIQKETDSFKNQNPETLAMAMYSMSMGNLHLYSLLGDPDVETMKSISARVDFAMRTVGFVDTSSGDKYEFP